MHPTLGPRICIIGTSSTGKSTLCHRLATTYGMTPVHLDTLYHQPYGNWIARPPTEFHALHDAAIDDDSWVMDGNYTKTMAKRFERATAIIDIRMNRFGCLWRFLKRYWQTREGQHRYGQPADLQEKFNWTMITHILAIQSLSPSRRHKYKERQAILNHHRHKVIVIKSFQDMEQLFAP